MALGKYSITNHLAKPAGPVNDQDERHSRWQPARQIYEAVAADSYSETDHLYIWIRLITRSRDYNVYVHYYDKAAVGGK